MNIRQVLAFVVIAIPASGKPARAQAMPANLSPSRQAMWKEIRAVCDSMEATFKRGDMKAVSAFYLDEAKMAGGGSAITTGRAAFDNYWGGLANRPGTWKLDIHDIGGSRELAFQRGRSTLTLKNEAGQDMPPMIVEFVVIWKRDAGGGLRILYDLY